MRKDTRPFRVLAVISLGVFVAPLFTKPEYFYISAVGCGLAIVAAFVHLLGPKERLLIAELSDNMLRIRPLKNPLLGIGSLYQREWRAFDLNVVTQITAVHRLSQADDYVRVTFSQGASAEEVFVRGGYREELSVFLKAVCARFPRITLEMKL